MEIQQENHLTEALNDMNLQISTNTSETFNENLEHNLSDSDSHDSDPDTFLEEINPEKLINIIDNNSDFIKRFKNVKILDKNPQLHRLQTIIRDVKSSRSDFCFAADRLIRLVIEAGLDL